jgi:hypothetical protein
METLRSHIEMIDLNPLIIDRTKVKAPGFAPADEFHSIWYQLKDRVQYLPGGLMSGDVSYHACFHDLPNGLQTHVYAPMGLDIKNKWQLGGTLPGEPAQPVELGLDIPKQGLYLREDVDMRCNFVMTSFVKKTLKKAHGTLVDRLLEKAKIRERDVSNEWVNKFHHQRNSTLSVSPMSSRPASISCGNLSNTLSSASVYDYPHQRLSTTGSIISHGGRSISDDGHSSTYGSPDLRLSGDARYHAYNPHTGAPLQPTSSRESWNYQAYKPVPRYSTTPPTYAAELPVETRAPVELPAELPAQTLPQFAVNVPAPLKIRSRPSSRGSQQPPAPVELAG